MIQYQYRRVFAYRRTHTGGGAGRGATIPAPSVRYFLRLPSSVSRCCCRCCCGGGCLRRSYFFPGMPNSQFVLHVFSIENWEIDYRKFELAIHDLHFRRILWGRKLRVRSRDWIRMSEPLSYAATGAECPAKDDQCLLLRPLSGLTHLLLWWC